MNLEFYTNKDKNTLYLIDKNNNVKYIINIENTNNINICNNLDIEDNPIFLEGFNREVGIKLKVDYEDL